MNQQPHQQPQPGYQPQPMQQPGYGPPQFYPQGQPPQFQQPPKKRSNNLVTLGVFALIVVVVGGGLWWAVGRMQDQRAAEAAAEQQARSAANDKVAEHIKRASNLRGEGKLEEAVRELETAVGNVGADDAVRMEAHTLLEEVGAEYGKQFEPKVAELIASAETSLASGDADAAEKHLKEATALRYAPNADEAGKLLALVIEARSDAKMKSFVLAMSDAEFSLFQKDLALPPRPAFERPELDAIFKSALKLNHDKAAKWRKEGSSKGSPSKTPPSAVDRLQTLLEEGKFDDAKALIQTTPSIAKDRSVEKDHRGGTALHIAAMIGTPETVQLLIDKGSDIEALNNDKLTPLWQAVWLNLTEHIAGVVRTLLKAGARIDYPPEKSGPAYTILGYVFVNVNLCVHQDRGIEVMSLLHIAGADVNGRDAWGAETPLHMAARDGRTLLCEWLLDNGAAINPAGKTNTNQDHPLAHVTPLHLARAALEKKKAWKTVDAAAKADSIARIEATIELLKARGGK